MSKRTLYTVGPAGTHGRGASRSPPSFVQFHVELSRRYRPAGGRETFHAKLELCVSDEDLVNDSLVCHSQPSRASSAPRIRLMEWRAV